MERELIAALMREPFGLLEIDESLVLFNATAPIECLLGKCRLSFINSFKQHYPHISREKAIHVNCTYIAWMGVLPPHRRRGLVSLLIDKATLESEQLGYHLSVAYCTSPKSRDAFVKAGYSLWGAIPYAGCEVNGSFPFSSIPDEVSIVVKSLPSLKEFFLKV